LSEITTLELPKKKRGTPRKPEKSTVEPAEVGAEPGAEPPEPELDELEPAAPTGAPGELLHAEPYPPIRKKVSPGVGFDYWNNRLTKAQRQNGGLSVYRLWPKLQLQMWNGRLVNRAIDKFSEEDGVLSAESVFKRKRIGIYLIRINQTVVVPNGTVTMFEVECRGSGDWPEGEMPDLDLDKLDLSHPSNEDYIRVLRSRGILKADKKDAEGDEEMAASEILGGIAKDAMDRLADRPPAQQNQQASAGDIAGVVTPIIGLLKEQINQNKPPAQQGTVLEMVTALSNLAKANAPAAQNMEPFLELQRQNNELVRQMMEKEVERAKADAVKAREEADAYKQAIPKQKSIDEQFDELERAAKRYQRITGKKDEETEEGEDAAAGSPAGGAGGWLGAAMGALPLIERIMAHGANMIYNWKLNGSGAPPLNPGTQQTDRQPAAPDTAPPVNSAAEQQQNEEEAQREIMQNVVNVLTQLEQPMMKFFLEGKTGSEFAEFTIKNYGIQTFATVGQLPKAALLNMLSQYPPVWSIVGPRIQDYTKFLDEFLNFKAGSVQ
jgi:hypothetical protein